MHYNNNHHLNQQVMGVPPESNDSSLIWKIALYALSAFLGLMVKLTTLYSQNKLVFRKVLKEVAITSMAVWITYNFCIIYHLSPNIMYLCGAIAARFGDAVIILTWEAVKGIVNKLP